MQKALTAITTGRARLVFLSLLALLSFTGCPAAGTYLDSLDYLHTEPQPSDLIGLYVPTDATQKDIRERGHYAERPISIQLSSDGAFTCTNIPDWWMVHFGKGSGNFISGAGSWKPFREQGYWKVGLHFSGPGNFKASGAPLFLVGAKPPFRLRIVLGDPDEGRSMDFVQN